MVGRDQKWSIMPKFIVGSPVGSSKLILSKGLDHMSFSYFNSFDILLFTNTFQEPYCVLLRCVTSLI